MATIFGCSPMIVVVFALIITEEILNAEGNWKYTMLKLFLVGSTMGPRPPCLNNLPFGSNTGEEELWSVAEC